MKTTITMALSLALLLGAGWTLNGVGEAEPVEEDTRTTGSVDDEERDLPVPATPASAVGCLPVLEFVDHVVDLEDREGAPLDAGRLLDRLRDVEDCTWIDLCSVLEHLGSSIRCREGCALVKGSVDWKAEEGSAEVASEGRVGCLIDLVDRVAAWVVDQAERVEQVAEDVTTVYRTSITENVGPHVEEIAAASPSVVDGTAADVSGLTSPIVRDGPRLVAVETAAPAATDQVVQSTVVVEGSPEARTETATEPGPEARTGTATEPGPEARTGTATEPGPASEADSPDGTAKGPTPASAI